MRQFGYVCLSQRLSFDESRICHGAVLQIAILTPVVQVTGMVLRT